MIVPRADQYCRSLLIIGGARSGKSRYAQRLAETSGDPPVLIATAQAGDAEMAARIARHAVERGPSWTVVEEPIALAAALAREAREDRIVVVDCATLWLSNLMLQKADLEGATGELAGVVARLGGPAIFVSNEVGQGIVPENRLARAFRDAQGRLNAALAAACEAAVVVIAGIAVQIKPADEPTFRF
jgi:adenosylcobinamide kinase / adenosylcobinamide-phosphate guanylyltransferase